MKLWIDSANLAEINQAWDMGIISGVTTNPSLIAGEKAGLEERLMQILAVVQTGPVNGEASGTTAEELIAAAQSLAALDPRIVVKIPITDQGLKAIKELKAQGIKTNATLIFSASQGLLAARAGADYISPFLGRLDDVGQSSEKLLRELRGIWEGEPLTTQIIAASIRDPEHVVMAAGLGCHIATVPFGVFKKMLEHPLTTAGIQKFEADRLSANHW